MENVAKTYRFKFEEALTSLSTTVNFKDCKNEWRYAGGDSGSHANYYNMIKDEYNLEEPGSEALCICTHPIVENCYIRHIKTNQLVVIGNCCIKRFMSEVAGRRCTNCDKIHKNRTTNLCNECRKVYCEFCKYELGINTVSAERGMCQECFGNKVKFGKLKSGTLN